MCNWEDIWNNRIYEENNVFEYNGYQFKDIEEYKKFITEFGKTIEISENSNILDLGCGNGDFINELIKTKGIINYTLEGIDFCQKNINYASAHYKGCFTKGNITSPLPYSDNKFDIIICMSTLFYLKDISELYNLFKELDRVRKSNSLIYLGNCMDINKKNIAIEQRKITHNNESQHLYINKNYIIDYYKRYQVTIIDNISLDIPFYMGQSYKFSVAIKIREEQNIGIDFHDTISAYPDFFRKLMSTWKGKRIIITGTPLSKKDIIIDSLNSLGIFELIHYDKIEYGYEYKKEDMDFNHFNKMKDHKRLSIIRNKINIYYDDNPFYVNYLKDLCDGVFQPILSKKYIKDFDNDKYFCCNLQSQQFDYLNNMIDKIKVYVPGTFDLFHSGHLKLINKIKKKFNCDLIVGVQDDESVKSSKGKYPIMNINERIDFIKNLENVQDVIKYNNMDQSEVLEKYKISVFIIGPEYGQYPEHEITLKYCKNNDIKVQVIERTEGISSSSIKNRMFM